MQNNALFYLIGLIGAAYTVQSTASEKYVVNETRVHISAPSEAVLIVTRDIKPSLQGEPRTLRDLVLENLMLIDAQKFNVRIAEDDIEKYLKQLQKLNNCTIEQLEGMFQSRGYSLAQGREQLRRREIIEQLQRFRVQDIHAQPVSRSDIDEHWKLHGPIEPASITLACAFVESDLSKIDFEQSLTQTRKEQIAWDTPVTVIIRELAPAMRSLAQGNPGDPLLIEPIKGGYEVTKILAKTPERPLPLLSGDEQEDKKRMYGIENAIRQERVEKALYAYECELLNQAASICRFTYEDDRKEVYAGCLPPEHNNN